MPSSTTQHGPDRRLFAVWVWLPLALSILFYAHMQRWNNPYHGAHAWVSAHFSTMAHNFNVHGIAQLRGVPLQNFTAPDKNGDFYLHWPPLFSISVALVFRVLGESENSAHLFMCLLQLSSALSLYLIVKRYWDGCCALIAVCIFLTAPIMLMRGLMVTSVHLSIAAALWSVYCWCRSAEGGEHRACSRWFALSILLLVIGVWASWEAVLIAPGLVVVHWRSKQVGLRKRSMGYALSGGLAVLAVLALYAWAQPQSIKELVMTAAYRANLSDYQPQAQNPHHMFRESHYSLTTVPSAAQVLTRYVRWYVQYLGGVPTIFLVVWLYSVVRRFKVNWSPQRAAVIAAFAGMPLIWYALLSNHAYNHDYELCLWGPLSAIVVVDVVFRMLRSSGLTIHLIVLLCLLPSAMVAHLGATAELHTRLVSFAEVVGQSTESQDIVIIPSPSMIPVYYSKRHIIRRVRSVEDVQRAVEMLKVRYPQAPLKLAVMPVERELFGAWLDELHLHLDHPHALIYQLYESP